MAAKTQIVGFLALMEMKIPSRYLTGRIVMNSRNMAG